MMSTAVAEEFEDRYSGRYFGKYRGFVSNVDDPRQLWRIMVKVPAVMGMEEELGWAYPDPAEGGGVNSGSPPSVQVNDVVWVEFEEGDPGRPIWTPGIWTIREGENMVPKHSRGEPDVTDYARRDYGNAPPSQFEGQYMKNRIMSDSSGNFLEMDASSGGERIQLAHRTGTRIEMQSDGGYQEIVGQSARRHIGEMHDMEIVGKEKYFVGGEQTKTIEGDVTEEYKGTTWSQSFRKKISRGESLDEEITGSASLLAGGTFDIKSLSQMGINSGGQLSIQVAQNLVAFASENIEIMAGNANGQLSAPPVLNSILLHGYNGKTVVQASDVTGEILIPRIEFDGLTGLTDIYAGLPGTGAIQLSTLTPANVFLGGLGAVEAVVKGTTFLAQLGTLTGGLQTFLSAMAADTGLAVVAPATVAAATAFNVIVGLFNNQYTNFPSLQVMTK